MTGTRIPAAQLIPRVTAAAALGVSAYLHFTLASGPWVSGGQLTLAALFRAQAVLATLVALWLLVRAGRAAWLAAAAVGAGSFAALVLSVYVKVPAIGPFPVLYEPIWYPDKVAAGVAAAIAALVAAAVLLRRLR